MYIYIYIYIYILVCHALVKISFTLLAKFYSSYSYSLVQRLFEQCGFESGQFEHEAPAV